MNLSKLLNIQKELDEHMKKEKGLKGQGLLDKKILALQDERGNQMRYYEFTEPFYMLIKSNSESNAKEVYKHCIGNTKGKIKFAELTEEQAISSYIKYDNAADRILLADSRLM